MYQNTMYRYIKCINPENISTGGLRHNVNRGAEFSKLSEIPKNDDLFVFFYFFLLFYEKRKKLGNNFALMTQK